MTVCIAKYNIRNEAQFDFRRNLSREDALANCSKFILDEAKPAEAVFIDLTKAVEKTG